MDQAKFAQTLENCRFCPMCRQVCPVVAATKREASSPRGLALDMYAVENGIYEPSTETHRHLVVDCTLCGACFESCVTQQDLGALVLAAREKLAEAGLACAEAVVTRDSLLQLGQPFGAEYSGKRYATKADPKADVIFFPGCTALYKAPETAAASEALLKAAGVSYMYLDTDCCGAPFKELGFTTDYEAYAQKLADKVAASGAKTLVAACTTCAYWLAQQLKDRGVAVVSLTDYLVDLVKEGKLALKGTTGKRVRVQSPCRMARSIGRFDPTPKLLQQAEGLTVDFYNAENLVSVGLRVPESLCCGGCGGTRFVDEATADAVAAYQMKKFTENTVDVEVIVTSCTTCKEKLGKAAGSSGLKVCYIAELLAPAVKG